MTSESILPANLRSIVDRFLARALHGRIEALRIDLYRRDVEASRRGVADQQYYRHEQEVACIQEFDERLHAVWASYRRVVIEAGLPWTTELRREIDHRIEAQSQADLLKLLEVASRVHALLPLALIVAEGTGRRISAWRNLVWEDIDFEDGTIHWRAEHDKKGYEQVVVMSDAVRDALAAQRKAQAAIGKTVVFPSPKDGAKPCNRHLFDDWLRRAFKLAKIVPQRRGIWHSIRRKWATERKGYPVKDVAAAGGWKTEEVLVTSYQQADAETIKNVVVHPTHRIASR